MVDILVVGGGIAGLSVAGRLSRTAKVTLLEAEKILGTTHQVDPLLLLSKTMETTLYGNLIVQAKAFFLRMA